MLYFSKSKIIFIYLIIISLSFFSLLNFINYDNNFFLSKKINLGLDLQGGSYLLLEVDSLPIINKNLQQKVLSLRKLFKKNNIKFQNLKLKNQTIHYCACQDKKYASKLVLSAPTRDKSVFETPL